MFALLRLPNFNLTLNLRNVKRFKNNALCALYHSKDGAYGDNPMPENQSSIDGSSESLFFKEELENRVKNANIVQFVNAYRTHGHKIASLDPLGLKKPIACPELSPYIYGLLQDDSSSISTEGIFYGTGTTDIKISELERKLQDVYCGPIAAEFEHLQTQEERLWFSKTFETRDQVSATSDEKIDLAKLLLKSQAFENFVATKFATLKRYGGEGGESMLACFQEILRQCPLNGVNNVVMCMPHRGRLSFLACLLDFPTAIMFRKIMGMSELPPCPQAIGDVLSHLYTSVDLNYKDGQVHLSLIPNPSHLEANNPVAAGKVRSKLQASQMGQYSDSLDARPGDGTLCLQVHGDASFTGQGVVAETFCFADAPHFSTGGSVHVIVNNQVGFTTEAERGRSSSYCSDIAKMNGYPVIHVNADFPEDVTHAARIAMEYRAKFRKDIIIDLLCFRKRGHNELDEPSFTQPRMYEIINNRISIPDLYAKQVVAAGLCKHEELSEAVQQFTLHLNENLEQAPSYQVKPFHLQDQWSSIVEAGSNITSWDTGLPSDLLKYVGAKSVKVPEDMKIHPTLQRGHVDKRLKSLEEGTDLDWATAEALAMGSLLLQGYHVRISGQDVGRGTFSHRHCMLVDQETDHIYIPLNSVSESQNAFLEVANSALSEEGVLGFEYGFSIDKPNTLVIWEAQFGDFFNAAQTIIDTYITSGELKWLLQSGLVMLLPNGMDGAGPEHSSCRLERFLQQCDSKEDKVDGDNVNFQVVNPTTSAQYFHLLRRQMVRNFRKPLIVSGPKTLLRLPAAASSLAEMGPGTHFLPVIADNSVTQANVTKVVFCSGKHYYALVEEREKRAAKNVALVRVESLCPFPTAELQASLELYPKANEFVWSQEEHRNMGAWTFVNPRFRNLVGLELKYAGREVLGAPAVGIGELHKKEIGEMMEQTFAQ